MHNKIAVVAICIAAFAMSAAAQTAVTTSGTTSSGTVPVFNGAATVTNSPITVSGSNVGIGATNPGAPLVVSTPAAGNPAVIKVVRTGGNVGGEGPALEFDDFMDSAPQGHIYTSLTYLATGNYSGKLILGSHSVASFNDELTLSAGNVGIGTTNPQAKLEINGNLRFTVDGSVQTTAWTGTLCGGDYAESVDVSGDRTNYKPGDVLVLDADNPGKMLKSIEAYSTSVSGIYSTKPGTVGRRQATAKSPDEVPMAVVGIVPAKVSAENGPIKVGDLLVTSSTPGYAMKGTDRSRMLGAVVGKAMAKLDSGTGVIEVLVTLQ